MVAFVKFISGVILNILYKIEFEGKENIPETGACILCANHVSALDMFFIGYSIKRLVRWMAKAELFSIPVVGWIVPRLGAFPIKRGKGDIDSIKTALKKLEEGHILGIFPEGTRVRGKSDRKAKVKRGIATLAMMSGAPILPVAIQGDLKPFTKVRIIFGEPIMLEFDKERKYTHEELHELTCDIMKKVYGLMGEDLVGNYSC